MIDTKELRRLAQAATQHVGRACEYRECHWLREGHVDFENADLFIASERPTEDAAFYAAANPATILELLDRLEAAEKERGIDEQRIADLMVELNRVGHENEALHAQIEEMKKQEPVGEIHRANSTGNYVHSEVWAPLPVGTKLYALPGAQPAPSIPELSDDLIEAIESRAERSYRRHHGGIRGQQLTPADALSWHIIHATRDVLAAAPEAKP